jgi:hypothetical protein
MGERKEAHMRKIQTRRNFLVMGVVCFVLLFSSSEAFSWGFGTHAYIDDHLGRTEDPHNLNEIYGGVMPDLFNTLFDYPEYLDFLPVQTHFKSMKVWKASRGEVEKSLAFGFVSHNNRWGADFTAHDTCRTCGERAGYAYVKAAALLSEYPLPPELGIPDEIAIEIFHEIVENAVDVLVKRADPSVGERLSSAAELRSDRFPQLLVRAYAKRFASFARITELEAAQFIQAAESDFREAIYFYGLILSQDDVDAISAISEQTASLAQGFLALYGIELSIPPEDVVNMVNSYMLAAIGLCQGDYLNEIEATIPYVRHKLRIHGVTY